MALVDEPRLFFSDTRAFAIAGEIEFPGAAQVESFSYSGALGVTGGNVTGVVASSV